MADWKDEVAQLDIADVAQKLGLQLAPGRRNPRLALCPFHDDSAPSLYLYQQPEPHYHCFVCQAHGDVVELVKQRERVDFAEALDWLAANFGIATSSRDLRKTKVRRDIVGRALDYWRAHEDSRTFAAFAKTRRFTVAELRSAGLALGSAEAFLASLGEDRAARDDAVAAGLAHAADTAVPAMLQSASLSPFVRGAQVFIPLSNLRGRPMGVMARKLTGEGPKYRFTAGFKKTDILYRGDKVRRDIEAKRTRAALDGAEDRFDLCLCEGVFDALRLEAVGIPAVAVLGAAISDKQLELLEELAELSLDAGRILRVHLFYDADKGGRRGVGDTLPRLLKKGAEADFLVDVVGVDRPPEDKADPDAILASLSGPEAIAFVRGALVSAMDALAAISLDQDYAEVPTAIAGLDAAGSIMLQNRLARRLQSLDWPKVWRKLAPDRTTLGDEPAPASTVLSQTYERLARTLEGSGEVIGRILPEPFSVQERTDDANLLHALILARESTDSREYPVDVAAWDRIEEGAQVFLPMIVEELGRPEPPKRPYLAHFEAKDSGAPRMKCGPCPEEAIQQQYVLSELLRVRPDRRDIAEQIPAVRYWADHPELVVTGAERPTSAVSFAYQIDMRALEERPDRTRRRDMFRPFLDCWNSFILHIGGRIDHMRSDLIYIARLDVKGFYDHVPRHAVDKILHDALPEADTLDNLSIAPLFGAETRGDRRQDLIDWILAHSFGSAADGYRYAHPGSGECLSKGGAKGLPQGPILSSYLANIVLFGLDAELERRVSALDADAVAEHGARARGGVYARYVDDIIIAARSPEDLRALRSAIEAKLDALGLELNEKSEHLEPMTAEEARNWVVERRGAGFVTYGDVDDQPSPAPDVRTSWADIPTLDRRTALSLLYWSALDDPEQTNREQFEAMLDTVARADGLRRTDLGHIARRIALRAALDVLDEADASAGPQSVVFETHLRALLRPIMEAVGTPRLKIKESDLAVAEALAAARFFFATMAGLERLILGSPETNPTFSKIIRAKIENAKFQLFGWILNENLLERLQDVLIAPEARSLVNDHLAGQIEILRATLEERTARAVRLLGGGRAFQVVRRHQGKAPQSPAAKCVRIGWFRTFSPDGLAHVGEADPPHLFHAIAAEIQAAGGRLTPAATASDLPAQALSEAMKVAADKALVALDQQPDGDLSRDFARAFRALAGGAEALDPTWRMRAVTAFLALSTGPLQTNALQTRPALLEGVAPNATILPLPPIPDQPGLFCYDVQNRVVRAVIVSSSADGIPPLPPELQWWPDPQAGQLTTWSAKLPDDVGFLLDPQAKVLAIGHDLDVIADVFEGLVEKYGARQGQTSTLVHVFALMGPLTREARESGGPGYFSLSWRLPREASEQLIFERRGDGIATQRSPHAGVELWRIGQAVSDLFSIVGDEVDDHTPIRLDRVLLQERLKRMAFSRLRGRWINGAQVAAALATHEIPKALTRIVRALRETSGSDERVGPLALEFFLSGRAMRNRMKLGALVDVAGGWSRYFEMIGARTLTPGDDEGLFSRADVREALPRASRALTRVSDSILGWAERAESQRCQNVLKATALGFEIAGLRAELRDFVLASLARMPAWDHERLQRVRPHLADLGAHSQMVLIEPRFSGAEAPSVSYDLELQARDLFSTLINALSLRQLPGRAALDRITTVGWLTILGVMTGVLDFSMEPIERDGAPPPRPAFFSLASTSIGLPVRDLAKRLLDLAVPDAVPDPEAWPWELAGTFDHHALSAALDAARVAMSKIAEAIGLVFVSDPSPLRLLELSDQHAELITTEGARYRLPWWRCSLVAISTERMDRAETAVSGERLVHPYSAIHDSGGRPLMIQVLSESLATVTGLRLVDDQAAAISGTAGTPAPQPEAASQSAAAAELANAGLPYLAPEIISAPSVPTATGAPTAPAAPAPQPPAKPPPGPIGAGDGVAGLRVRQHRAWKARGVDSGLAASGYGRIAILQYDFLDSYYPEKFPKYRLKSSTSDALEVFAPGPVPAGPIDQKLSFEEHRRRQVLRAMLDCCNDFGVEALVLPEYSVWPETINWMEELCRLQDYKVSIWAGTFRQQPGFELALTPAGTRFAPVAPDDIRTIIWPMEAILSVLFRETQPGKPLTVRPPGQVKDENPIFSLTLPEGLVYRPKKYPSIGMYEEFKPSRALLSPLMSASRSLNRIESFVSELVCSELFVFNGPLNWINFADHLTASAARYKVDTDGWVDLMIDDAREAAKVFSGAQGHKPRRSILFLTCATSRDADYHYFAQNAYLASGIVTAFCNSSQAPALGGSCFVGPGGWETRGAAHVPGPYHGSTPGVLTINNPDRGALGARENALIIADVRPERTAEDRPKSQTLTPPMRLVAHLPIIEDRSGSPVEDLWDMRWWRPAKTGWLDAGKAEEPLSDQGMHALLLQQIKTIPGISLNEFADKIGTTLDALLGAATTARLGLQQCNTVIAAGLSLANLFNRSPGMRHRAAAMTKGLRDHPEAIPCPALLDWIIVPLDVEGFEARVMELRDQVTPYVLGAFPPSLREAPWRWIPPTAQE